MASRSPASGELPSGLIYRPNFIDFPEERQIVEFLENLEFRAVTMRGQTALRTVRHFGLNYEYATGGLHAAEPLPLSIVWLRNRVADLMHRDSEDLAQILISHYPPGAGIGWHRDATSFGPAIAGVSLLGRSTMRFQRTVDGVRRTAALVLEPRSAYLLADEARTSWQHSIPAGKERRYSITFRTMV